MADGGINDQLGGGFCRYSVDEYWTIPHFEKMLYDNAALLAAICRRPRWQAGMRCYARVAHATAGWVLQEMQAPPGGYYSSLDADSQGHEGTYYVWDREEVRAALSAQEFAVFAPRYGLDQPPNFEGRWHLRVVTDIADIADDAQTAPLSEVESLLASAAAPAARDSRPSRAPGA